MSTKRKPGRPAPAPPAPVDPTPVSPPAGQMGNEGLASLIEAAKFLGGVHVNTVKNLISRKELPGRKVGNRIKVPWAALKAYAAAA